MISIEHVSKSYAKSSVKAVDDINLHVKRGEVFGFIGPNGAGQNDDHQNADRHFAARSRADQNQRL